MGVLRRGRLSSASRRDGKDCDAVTGAALVAPQFKWIAETAKAMGAASETDRFVCGAEARFELVDPGQD